MARYFARFFALALGVFAAASAHAQTYTYTFYVGNSNATGCTVATAAGPVEHVKWRLQATVTAGTNPQFGAVSRADCVGGVFGSPSAVATTSAIGLNTGTAGSDVIEVQLPVGVVGPTPSPREVLAVVASSNTASDALIATTSAAPSSLAKGVIGPPSAPIVIPTLGALGALLLGIALLALGWFALRRYARLWPLALLLVAGSAWAVAIVIDGQVDDWAMVAPSTDPAADVGETGIDLRALYVTTQGPNGYLRVDVTDLQNPPVATPGSASVLEDGSTTITLTGSDPGGAPLTFQIASPPTSGALGAITPIDATSASVLYTPNADAFGDDSFSFTVDNGTQTSAPALVAITITPVNDAPSFSASEPPAVNEGSGAHSLPGWASFDPGPANESDQAVLEYLVGAIGNPALFAVAPSVAPDGTLSYTLAAQANGTSTFEVAVRDDGGTANGGVDLGTTQTFTITVDAVNGAPGFVAGGDVAALEDAGAQTVAGWASAIDDGDPEQTQTLGFAISANSNPALFAAGPSIDATTGDLSYTPAPDANGTATLSVVLGDDGGTANGGNDTSAPQSFSLTIIAVNDAPSFTAVDPPAVNEGSGAHSVPNWASFDPGPADEAGQAVAEYQVGAIGNPGLFAVAPGVAPDGTLSYTVAPGASGSSTFSVAVRDDGGVANGGDDLSASQVFTLTVNAVNSAPSFVGGGDVSSAEDGGAQSFAAWATAITDGDPEPQALTFNVTGNSNPGLFSAAPAVDATSGTLSYTSAANASGSATITLTLSDDGGTANGGSDTSAPYSFTITVDAVNDAPTATAKAHITHSAIELEIVAASHTGELLEGAADIDDPAGELTAVYVAGSATPAGAQVTITDAASGSFRYDPPGGASGAGSFQFRICDDGVPAAPQQCSAATTVSFSITGPDLYFVDDNAAPGGDGGLNDPFDALSDLPGARGNNDRIFVHAGSYPAAVHSFFVGEHLVGQGATGAFDSLLGVVVPANGALDARPALTGAVTDRPALERIVMAGANGAVLRGVALSTASSESVFINGTTGVTVSDTSAASSISGININNSSASAEGVTFSSVSSTGGLNGIVLNNLAGPGAFDFGGGALTGNTGVSFRATGTLATTSYAGNISKNSSGNIVEIGGVAAATDTGSVTLSGNLSCSGCGGIDVVNRDGGTITFSGSSKALVTGAQAAVTLDNNDGTTIDFTGGGLALASTSGIAFNAINGAAAISVQGAGNTLASTSGVALKVENSTIGAAGLTFRSIASNGSSSGIVLNSTGTLGSLAVTGSGTAGSGGTVQNTSSHGVWLIDTKAPSFTSMLIQGTGGSGVNGTGVNGFSFVDGTITGSGDALGESNIAFNGNGTLLGNNFSGVLTVTGSTLSNAFDHGLHLQGDAGTVDAVVIQNNTFTSSTSSATSKGYGIQLVGTGNGTSAHGLTRASITGNTIRNFPGGGGIQVSYGNVNASGPGGFAGTPGSASDVITIADNSVSGQSASNRMGAHAIIVSVSGGNAAQRSGGNFIVRDNGDAGDPVGNTSGSTLAIGVNGHATVASRFENNVVVANNSFGSSGLSGGNGILLGCAAGFCESPDATISAIGNTISQTDGNGILLVGRGNTGLAKFGIRNNTVAAPLGGTRPGIRVDAGNASAGSDDAVCLDLSGNTSGGSGGHEGIGLRKQGSLSTIHDFGVEGMAATATPGVETFVGNTGQNPGSASGSFGISGVLLVSATSGYSNCASAP
jgi:hypothetical protein